MENFGKTLRRFRTEAGVTQRQLALKLNVDPTAISQYENGHRNFPVEFLEPACECMGISVWDFLEATFPEPRPNRPAGQ